MKIVVLESMAVNPGDLSWDWLSEFGETELYPRLADPEETARRLRDAEVVLVNKTPVDGPLLDRCPRLKLVCVLATGYNVIDCAAARSRGVAVCNVPAYGTTAVAQFTFGLLLELCHRIGHHDRLVHEGRWSSCPDFCFWDTPQMELAGKTLGIIGYGRIGQAVGKIAAAFGMEVLAYSRRGGFPNSVSLDTLLQRSDVVSLHCPLTPETTGLINRETIAKMKDGAILLNTSRGAALDEAAVAQALASGKLRAAAVDVAAREPIPADSPLLTAPNCIITPHMAWAPKESRQRILDTTMDSIRAFLSGNPINRVN
jgi:glycerate dehydrogenase